MVGEPQIEREMGGPTSAQFGLEVGFRRKDGSLQHVDI